MSLDALKAHLFEAMEGVKNLSDDKADECEKTSIQQAKQIVNIAEAVLDVYKLQVEAFKTFAKLDNIAKPGEVMADLGIASEDDVKLLQ